MPLPSRTRFKPLLVFSGLFIVTILVICYHLFSPPSEQSPVLRVLTSMREQGSVDGNFFKVSLRRFIVLGVNKFPMYNFALPMVIRLWLERIGMDDVLMLATHDTPDFIISECEKAGAIVIHMPNPVEASLIASSSLAQVSTKLRVANQNAADVRVVGWVKQQVLFWTQAGTAIFMLHICVYFLRALSNTIMSISTWT